MDENELKEDLLAEEKEEDAEEDNDEEEEVFGSSELDSRPSRGSLEEDYGINNH